MPKNESFYTQKLLKQLRSHEDWVVFKHADGFNAGHPDMSVSFNNTTTWLESKHVPFDPYAIRLWRVLTPGIQMVTMNKLARTTHAFYIVVAKDYSDGRAPTLVIRGDHMLEHVQKQTTIERAMSSWDLWGPDWLRGHPVVFPTFDALGIEKILRLLHRRPL